MDRSWTREDELRLARGLAQMSSPPALDGICSFLSGSLALSGTDQVDSLLTVHEDLARLSRPR